MHRLTDEVVLTCHLWVVCEELFGQLLYLCVEHRDQLKVEVLQFRIHEGLTAPAK